MIQYSFDSHEDGSDTVDISALSSDEHNDPAHIVEMNEEAYACNVVYEVRSKNSASYNEEWYGFFFGTIENIGKSQRSVIFLLVQ